MPTPKTVLLKGDPLPKEAVQASGQTITPGHLLERVANGEVQPHSGGGSLTPVRVAREMELVGNGIDTDYQDGDTVLYYHARPGDEFYMLLAAGETVTDGDELESNGDGTLVAQSGAEAGGKVVTAIEDVDASGASDPVRIKVEVI